MTKNQKILLGVGIGVVVLGGIGIAVYSSKKKKREEELRQQEYERSLQNNQTGGGGNIPTNSSPTLGENLGTVLGAFGTLWKNRPKKKDPRDVEPITTTEVRKIDNTPTVAKPNWNLAFSGFEGGDDYMEVGSELDDLD